MTRKGMLALLAAGQAGIPTPPQPSTPPQPPAAADSVITQMRPYGHRRIITTLEVAADGSKPYSSITAAIAAARTAQTQKMVSESVSMLTPDYWVSILVQPGTYPERGLNASGPISVIATAPEVNVVEAPAGPATGNPTDWGADTLAGGGYWEGINFRQPASDPAVNLRGKYLMHNVVQLRYATVFARCSFAEENPNADALYGQNSAAGHNLTWYDCTLTSVGPSFVHYAIGTVNLIKTHGGAGMTNYSAGGDADGDDHLWVDATSSWPGGVGISAGGSMHAPATTASAINYTGSLRDYRTDWPVPTGGLTPDNHTYWYG